MPLLTFTTSNATQGGLLTSRVLIGRRLSHGVVLNDPSVSRLHAWIDPVNGDRAEWVIVDAGSKTGTFVNDQKITRHPLQDGDRIRVGAVTLTYQEQDQFPHGITEVELSAPSGVVKASGILFECACGAPLWVGNDLAGKRGMCRHCRQPVTVPALAAIAAPPVERQNTPAPSPKAKPSSTKRSTKCAVCHSAILDGEDDTQCPDCAMHFHTECWQENFGCSSYGCPQVNVLQPADAQPKNVPSESADAEAVEQPRATPWEPILLGGSVVGTLLGALLFGGLDVVIGGLAIFILIKTKPRRPALLFIAIGICVLGIFGGLGVSDFWYFGGRHLPAVLMPR